MVIAHLQMQCINIELYKLDKAEKTPVGLWLAYIKPQLPFSKLQVYHIFMH